MAAINTRLHASLPIPNLSFSPPTPTKSPPLGKMLSTLKIPSQNAEAQSYHDESNIFEEILLICVLPAGDSLQLTVKSGETVQEIKRKLDATHGIPFSTCSLLHNGNLLMDPLSLNDFPGLIVKSPLSLSEGGNVSVTLQVKITHSPVVPLREPIELESPLAVAVPDFTRSAEPDDAGMEHAYSSHSKEHATYTPSPQPAQTVHILTDSPSISTSGLPLTHSSPEDPTLAPLSLSEFGSVKSLSHIYFDADVDQPALGGAPLNSYSPSSIKSFNPSRSESLKSDRTTIDVVDDLGDSSIPDLHAHNDNQNDDRLPFN